MINANVMTRTFHIQNGDKTGTAFTIDHEGRQYLVTAAHVVEGIGSGGILRVFHGKQWKTLQVELVGTGPGDVDVAVLACRLRLGENLPLEASAGGLMPGQTVHFLGFPFGWDGGGEYANSDFPFAFIKAGVLSAITTGAARAEGVRIYIDGHNNEGFSGGPVVFVPAGQPPSKANNFKVAGVVSGYPRLLKPIVDGDGQPIARADNEPALYFQENPGFVVAFDIRHAIDLIEANPIGLELADAQGSP